ncbi:response regulator transcription factor [Dermatophilaceae bacterium Soc4.6]
MPSDPPPPGEPTQVLVVEDDPSIATMITLQLELSGYRAHVERDGIAGLAAVRSRRPAVVLLDIGLPGLDGIEVCRALRAEGDWTPILFVTARDDEVDRVVGLELGADDYVTKPFSPREVIARIGSILRRSSFAARDQEEREADDRLVLGQVRLLPHERRVTVRDVDVPFTATEFDLLAHLMATPARVWTREQLLDQVWGSDTPSGRRTVDVHVAQVRAKLGDDDVIRTVRGVGYCAQPPRGVASRQPT